MIRFLYTLLALIVVACSSNRGIVEPGEQPRLKISRHSISINSEASTSQSGARWLVARVQENAEVTDSSAQVYEDFANLSVALNVVVTDEVEQPVPDIPVAWTITQQEGRNRFDPCDVDNPVLAPSPSLTNPQGISQATLDIVNNIDCEYFVVDAVLTDSINALQHRTKFYVVRWHEPAIVGVWDSVGASVNQPYDIAAHIELFVEEGHDSVIETLTANDFTILGRRNVGADVVEHGWPSTCSKNEMVVTCNTVSDYLISVTPSVPTTPDVAPVEFVFWLTVR